MSTHQHDHGLPRPEAPERTGRPHEAQAPQVDPDEDPRAFWEGRYGGDRVWSGKVNATTAALVAGLDVAPGRALDLGCGEGGDVLHLAEAGWDATGIDLSEAAVARARDAARERGVTQRTRFLAADLSDPAADWGAHEAGAAGYDLVTASFLQSPVALDRRRILRRAADSLAPGGHLVLVSHGAPPPWAPPQLAERGDFPSPAAELAALGAPADGDARWEVLTAELRERDTTGPDGRSTRLKDTVVVVRRR